MLRWREWLDKKVFDAKDQRKYTRLGTYSKKFIKQESIRFPWWSLPAEDFMTDLIFLWWSEEWKFVIYYRYLYSPFFRFITKIGLWKVKEADYYNNGKLQFPDMWTRWRY